MNAVVKGRAELQMDTNNKGKVLSLWKLTPRYTIFQTRARKLSIRIFLADTGLFTFRK